MKDKIKITKEQAIKAIDFNEDNTVHTFLNAPFGLVGADREKASIIDSLNNADWIEIAGKSAQEFNHAIAIVPKGWKSQGDIIFVQSKKEEIKKLEKKK